jgi:hypothetical protein
MKISVIVEEEDDLNIQNTSPVNMIANLANVIIANLVNIIVADIIVNLADVIVADIIAVDIIAIGIIAIGIIVDIIVISEDVLQGLEDDIADSGNMVVLENVIIIKHR